MTIDRRVAGARSDRPALRDCATRSGASTRRAGCHAVRRRSAGENRGKLMARVVSSITGLPLRCCVAVRTAVGRFTAAPAAHQAFRSGAVRPPRHGVARRCGKAPTSHRCRAPLSKGPPSSRHSARLAIPRLAGTPPQRTLTIDLSPRCSSKMESARINTHRDKRAGQCSRSVGTRGECALQLAYASSVPIDEWRERLRVARAARHRRGAQSDRGAPPCPRTREAGVWRFSAQQGWRRREAVRRRRLRRRTEQSCVRRCRVPGVSRPPALRRGPDHRRTDM